VTQQSTTIRPPRYFWRGGFAERYPRVMVFVTLWSGLLCLAIGGSVVVSAAQRDEAQALAGKTVAPKTIDLLADDAGLGATVDGQRLLKYAVQCVLPAGEKLMTSRDGESVTLDGALGLAPEWRNHPLSETDQRWLSACVLSRINAFGVTVLLSLRGQHPALTQALGAEEKAAYGFAEAAFFGNVFANPPVLYTCRGNGGTPIAPTRQQRVCSETSLSDSGLSRCGMVVLGDCANVCSTRDLQQGFYRDCSGGGRSYAEVITVFLKNN